MSDKRVSKEGDEKEIDFMSNPSLQLAVKKSKRKQTLKYIGITVFTTIVLLYVLISGSQYILNQRIEDDNQKSLLDPIYGANLSSGGGSYNYDLFSVTVDERTFKTVGDRSILWDTKIKKIPLFGRVETLSQGSGMIYTTSLDKEAHRHIRYNDFNNERRIDFYYPNLRYDYLPHELDIAIDLDKNKLIEVAISFDKPMTLAEISKQLGYKNVNWLWVDTSTKAQMSRMEDELDNDSVKTKGGGGAFGFDINPQEPYSSQHEEFFMGTLKELQKRGVHKSRVNEALKGVEENTRSTEGKIRYNGAVVTGTAEELKRFQDLAFIRASVLGATIDKY
jgi:hypothetical protein